MVSKKRSNHLRGRGCKRLCITKAITRNVKKEEDILEEENMIEAKWYMVLSRGTIYCRVPILLSGYTLYMSSTLINFMLFIP